MTQVAMIFEEEKQQAVRQAVEEERKKAFESEQQAVKRTVEEEKKKASESEQQIVINMIKKGYSTEEIVSLIFNYSKNDVEMLRKKNGE